MKLKSTILPSSSEIIASKCLERQKKKDVLMTVSQEKNFSERLVQIYFAKHCS